MTNREAMAYIRQEVCEGRMDYGFGAKCYNAIDKQVACAPEITKVPTRRATYIYECVSCGDRVKVNDQSAKLTNYCRYCGRKLKEGDFD